MKSATTLSKESKTAIVILTAVASLVLCIAACTLPVLIRALRVSTSPPERPFILQDLFPKDLGLPYPWSQADWPPSTPCRAAPLGSHCRSFAALSTYYPFMEFPGGGARLEIHQYISAEDAERDYARL